MPQIRCTATERCSWLLPKQTNQSQLHQSLPIRRLHPDGSATTPLAVAGHELLGAAPRTWRQSLQRPLLAAVAAAQPPDAAPVPAHLELVLRIGLCAASGALVHLE